jgi:hypothetical protein
VHIFIDEDSDPDTGYRILGLGADTAIEVLGWNGTIEAQGYSTFNASRYQMDLNGFDAFFDLPVKIGESELETKLWLSPLTEDPEQPVMVLFATRDTEGNEDLSDIVISQVSAALGIEQTAVAPDIVQRGSASPMLKLDVSAFRKKVSIISINLTRTGTSANNDIEGMSIYLDSDRNGIFESSSDEMIRSISPNFIQNSLTVPLDLTIPKGEKSTLFIVPSIAESAQNTATLGMRIARPSDVVLLRSGVVTLTPIMLTNSYIGAPADNITIDGAFADWKDTGLEPDTFNDVRIGNGTTLNGNIDILNYAVSRSSDNLSFYLDVAGTMLGGTAVPWNASRPAPLPVVEYVDSDGDGYPDRNESGFELDFDNDGIEDAFDSDDDNDGITDWPEGNDTELVQPVTGRRKYKGPVRTPPVNPVITGEDVAYIFLDTDNDPFTGFYLTSSIGADFMINISGKANLITSRTLYAFNSSHGTDWKWNRITQVSAAVDTMAMEAQVDFQVLGIPHNQTFRVWFFTTDWRDAHDLSDSSITETRGVRGTRGPGAKVVINEVFSDANGWVELYNRGNVPKDISDWVITWSGGSYTVPQGTVINPGQFLAFDVGSISASDTVTLYDDRNRQQDSTSFESVPPGQAWGRYPDGEDSWEYTSPTKAAPNQPAYPPPPNNILINEVYSDVNGWVELFNNNQQGQPTDISGWVISWSTGSYTIPANTRIKTGNFLALDVGSIPASDTVTLYDGNNIQQDSATFSNIPLGYGWGRYPDGSGNWWVTNPTKEGPNSIPEFGDIFLPLILMILFGLIKKNVRGKKIFKTINSC